MRSKIKIIIVACIMLAGCNKIEIAGHCCPFQHCPYKGIPNVPEIYMQAITNYTGCEEGTDCHIIDCLHFVKPDADYDTLEQMMWED
jgi:hypothetical protein